MGFSWSKMSHFWHEVALWHNITYFQTDGFSAVSNYGGDLKLAGPGTVEIAPSPCGRYLLLHYSLDASSGGCNRRLPQHPELPACTMALSTASNCSDTSALGEHYWGRAPGSSGDPWLQAQYIADAKQSYRYRTLRIPSSLNETELFGHAVVLLDSGGEPAACGLLLRTWYSARFANHHAANTLATCATCLSVVLTTALVCRHFRMNKHRALRRYTVRILLMVPIFSLQALTAMILRIGPLHGELMKLIREVYEAIVILSFLQFNVVCMGGPARLVAKFQQDGVDIPVPRTFPWRLCLPPWQSAETMLRYCTLGTMSYVLVGAVVGLVGFVLDIIPPIGQWYVEKWLFVSRFFMGLAQATAVTSLVELTEHNIEDLRPLHPIAKFLSVKLVVFFTFWQSLIIKHLVHKGLFLDFFDNEDKWGNDTAQGQGVLNVVVCMEMLVVSVAHFWVFPPKDFELLEHPDDSLPEAGHCPPETISGLRRTRSTVYERTRDVFSCGDVLDTVFPDFQACNWRHRRSWYSSAGRKHEETMGMRSSETEESSTDQDTSSSSPTEDEEVSA